MSDSTTGAAYYNGTDLGCTELEASILKELVRMPEQVLTTPESFCKTSQEASSLRP